jgi:hypothetical protein
VPQNVYDATTYGYADGPPADEATEAPAAMSSLDDLRLALDQVSEVADQDFPDFELFSPGDVIRLTCSTDLAQPDLKRIQLAALPLAARRKRIPDLKKLDEVTMYAGLIGEQVTEIALKQPDGSYRPLAGGFDSPTVLAAFGAAEPAVAVQRIFVKDVFLLRAGEALLDRCGYGESKPGESDADPT